MSRGKKVVADGTSAFARFTGCSFTLEVCPWEIREDLPAGKPNILQGRSTDSPSPSLYNGTVRGESKLAKMVCSGSLTPVL